MKIQEYYNQAQPGISFELFPPKKWSGIASLYEHFKELISCEPSFITCTYGAGGGNSAEERTLDVLRLIHSDYPDIPLASHLTCINASKDDIREYMRRALEIGIKGVGALRGDAPKDGAPVEFPADGCRYANELVAMLREEYPDLRILVAGYPETHPEAESPEADLVYLKQKVDAGADAIITQLFYDNDTFFRFRDRCDAAGIEVPIVPGILPVTTLAQAQRITGLCGATLTEKLTSRLEAHGDDVEGQESVGVYYAARQVEELVEAGVPGVHFYVMNKSRAAALICRALNLSKAGRSQSEG